MEAGRLVIDLETQKSFADVGGRNYEDLLISVMGVYRYETNQYECYRENQLHLFENLLIDCSLVIGFNVRKFDLPVFQHYARIDTSKLPILDILEDIVAEAGHRVSLDSVALATLNKTKTGHGLEAIDFFQQGKWEALESYCMNDVKITKEVYDYGVLHGHIYFMTRDGSDRKQVKVNWHDQVVSAHAQTDFGQYNLGF